jgi:uncharacterized membrane protein
MRGRVAVAMILVGLLLMVVSYFWWGAPWGTPPSGPEYSNPQVPFSSVIFIVGVMLIFLAAVLYELLPDRA